MWQLEQDGDSSGATFQRHYTMQIAGMRDNVIQDCEGS